MARRTSRANPLAGGNGVAATATNEEAAPDPFAGLEEGGAAPDPFAGFDEGPAVSSGLDALGEGLSNGTSALPSDPSAVFAQLGSLLAAVSGLASDSALKQGVDHLTNRLQVIEAKQEQHIKQIEACYKKIVEFPDKMTELLGKWFDESLSKFTSVGAGTGGTAPASQTPPPTVSQKPATKTDVNAVHENILAALLPDLRNRRKANGAFKLPVMSKGAMVWNALHQTCLQKGMTGVALEDVKAAFQPRINGDDIDLA